MPGSSLPTRALPERPDLDQLKRQAGDLLAAFRAGEPDAASEVTAHYGGADPATFALHEAQLVLARAYGFASWPRLKAYIDGVTVAGLAAAVSAGDMDKVRTMLAARPEIVHLDVSEHDEHRVLHYAVLARNPEMVRVLMDHGADPLKGIWPHRGATSPLTIASERGYDEIVAIIDGALERRRAEEPTRAPDGEVAAASIDPGSPTAERVKAAVLANDEAAVIACLEADSRLLRGHSGDGWTMLHHASLMLLVDVARWLVAHGADVNAYEPSLWTPLELVGRYRKNFTPEKAAAMTDLLVSHGARMTAGAAITHGDAGWLRARHEEGVLTDPPGSYGLVSRAVISGRADMITLLIDLGFDPDERRRLENIDDIVYSWGEPLRSCAIAGRADLAEVLLTRGADPNPSIYAASSPMFEAYRRGHRDVIAAFERHGGFADAGIVGHFGLIGQARQMIADEAAGRLRPRTVPEGGTVAASLLVSGADGGQPDIVRLAVEALDWPREDPRWHWNLMRPLGAHRDEDRERYLNCFALMVERAGANAPGPYGRTMLHDICAGWPRETSSAQERVRLATILLDAGARFDRRDDLLKSTPLGWACRWGRLQLVKLFLERGADPVEPDADVWATPSAWAGKMKHEPVVTLLQQYVRSASG
jgi:ankyrin repeat protein